MHLIANHKYQFPHHQVGVLISNYKHVTRTSCLRTLIRLKNQVLVSTTVSVRFHHLRTIAIAKGVLRLEKE